MFFITSFEHLPDKKYLHTGDTRTFGYFDDREKAVRSLHENWCDMHECLYRYAVIEEIGQGIHPDVQSRTFFEYDKERNGFFEIEEPKEVKHVCNFALG